MEQFIVTGGAGLIGSNLVAALNARGIGDILVTDHLNHPLKEKNLARLSYARYLDRDAFRTALRAGEIAPAQRRSLERKWFFEKLRVGHN